MRGFMSDNKWGIDVIPSSLPKKLQDAVNSGNTEAQNEQVVKIGAKMGAEQPPQDLQELLNLKASRVNKLLDYLWLDSRLQSKLSQVLLSMFQIGTGLLKSVYDPDGVGDSGSSQIETVVVDPFYFYPDPDATSMHDGSYYIEKHPVSVRWVIERYPEKAADFLKSMGMSEMDLAPRGIEGVGKAKSSEGKQHDVLEVWYKDSAVTQDDESGTFKEVYPNGRYTLMSSNGFVLEDKPCEYKKFPYVRFVEIPMPNEFWGGSTVDKVADLQIQINQLLRSIIDNGLWLVHGIWVVDDTSGLEPDDLAGYGMRDVLVKRAGSEVRRDVGEPLPHTIFQTLEALIVAFDRVAGIPDIMRGIAPSRQPVGTTQLQQESGEVRTRERSRRVEEALADLGQLWLAIVGDFWADKRSVRNQRPVGGFDMFQLDKRDFEGWAFDLFVLPGSTTPLDTSAAFDRAKMMRVEMQIPIPDSYFIRAAQIPGLEASVNQSEQAAKDAAQGDEVPAPDPAAFGGMDIAPPDNIEGDQFPEMQATDGVPPEQLAQFP